VASDQWNLKRIKASQAWDISQGSNSILAAFFDPEGYNRNHPDLTTKFDGGDLVSGSGQHGTETAGMLAAATNNSVGIASLGWNIMMRPYFFQDRNYEGISDQNSLVFDIHEATIAQNPDVDIINLSILTLETVAPPGGGSGSCEKPKNYNEVSDEIAIAIASGIIVVAGTGNTDLNATKPACSSLFPFVAWPASSDNVIGVTATDINDNHAPNYNYEGPAADEFIDMAAPAYQIVTTSGNGYGEKSGSSFAAPQVSALVGLMLSLNSGLTSTNVWDILTNTAEKVGQDSYTNGRNSHLGYGRINAYQALLLTHAYSNKSMSSGATAFNNGRRIVKDGTGKYHLVFESGITSSGNILSEIFYRRSNVGGTSWDSPIRLSAGNEQNRYPCIAERNGILYVIWQRKNGSTHDIYFATSQDGGTTWSNYVLASTALTADPLPVIQAGVTTNFSLMTIYRSNSGGTTRLVARRTTSVNPALADWSAETTVPSTGANDFSPTMASTQNYWGQDANFGVAYATTSGIIQYRYYQHATGGWSSTQFNLSAIVPGSNLTHKEPSLANAGAGFYDVHVAWHRVIGSGSSNYDHAIIYRKSNGFDNWPNAYTQLYYEQQQFPSITALPSGQVNVLFQLTSVEQVYKQNYNGFYWGSPVFVSSGKHPSVSTGSSSTKYVWTSAGATAPYSISLSSETLSKLNSNSLPYYSRSMAWLDHSGAYLEVIVHQLGVKLKDGTEQKFEFTPTYEDSIPITPANSWEWLAAAPTLLPAAAESLIVDYTVAASVLEKVVIGSGGNRYVNIDLTNASGQKLASLTGLQLPASGSIAKTTRRLAMALNGRGIPLNSASLQANVNVQGMASKSGTFASLGHIYDFTKLGPQNLSRPANSNNGFASKTTVLFENYPDPFNPETAIKYQIPEASRVTLKIYNVVGQEVRTLVDRFQNAGTYEIRWDGKDGSGRIVPSGVYLYRMQAGEFFEIKKMTLLR